MGVYYLNFAKMVLGKLHSYHYFSTFSHEFTHILGFSDNRFTDFVDADRKQLPKDKILKGKKKVIFRN